MLAVKKTSVTVQWDGLETAAGLSNSGRRVTVAGYPVAALDQARTFLLAREPSCCPGCAPNQANATIQVDMRAPVPLGQGLLRVSGRWHVRNALGTSRYGLDDAILCDPPGWAGVTRRAMLMAGPLICLPAAQDATAVPLANPGPKIDIHSHAGGISSPTRMRSGQAFGPVAEPMRKGGMGIICLAIVSDGPTHRLATDGRLHPYRDPEPGELYAYAQLAFGRVHAMARDQGLRIITGAAGLRPSEPGIIVTAEGADFLEGQPDRVDEAYARWSLRHLQLTHYRVNELGDIQTEPPMHGGLTDQGAEVIRRCNRLGIVVDVAHGTFDLVKRAASVTTRPLVLSHTSLARSPSRFSRRITTEHAQLVARTGGVVGVWPPESEFSSLDALAAGMARMVDAVGIDHVGLGSDMRGLVGPSVFADYDRLPDLTEALLRAGFAPADAAKILGGNYARVFEACVGAG